MNKEEILHSLLPYQARWVADPAGFKVIEKARRIGISWAEAYDAVMHAGSKGGGNVYYQAYNLEMTRGFIEDCAGWAQRLQSRAGALNETLMEQEGRAVRAFRIAFPSGNEILAMTSAPRAFRSKGRPGDLAIVDEAAFVDDLGEVLKAALAFRVWGGRAHVISTHNGEANPFATLCREIDEGARPGSLHRTTLKEALAQGLFRRIVEGQGRPWSAAAEAEWEGALRAEYGSHSGEELDCIPAAGGGAWLAWEAIRTCEDPIAGDPAAFAGGPPPSAWTWRDGATSGSQQCSSRWATCSGCAIWRSARASPSASSGRSSATLRRATGRCASPWTRPAWAKPWWSSCRRTSAGPSSRAC